MTNHTATHALIFLAGYMLCFLCGLVVPPAVRIIAKLIHDCTKPINRR